MQQELTSIPELIKKLGNLRNVARYAGIAEVTVAKYKDDVNMIDHCVLNGRLMSARSTNKGFHSLPQNVHVDSRGGQNQSRYKGKT